MDTIVYRNNIAPSPHDSTMEFNSIRMSIHYVKGRGIYLTIYKANTNRESGDYSITFDFNPRTHTSVCLEQLGRANPKRMRFWETQLARRKEGIADAFLSPADSFRNDMVAELCRL